MAPFDNGYSSTLINKLSPLIEGQVPDFVQADHPVFVNFVKDSPLSTDVRNVISNSFGFGGTNVSLIFSRFNGK